MCIRDSLKAILDEQKKPVSTWVEGLGTFTLNRTVDWFEATVDWLGSEIALDFDRGVPEEMASAQETGRALMASQADWDHRVRSYAAQDVYKRQGGHQDLRRRRGGPAGKGGGVLIFANGRLLPDSQLSQVLEELEEAVNETRACRTLEPETVISALQAVGERLDRGELDPLILRYAGPGGRREVAHIRPLLRREALEYKLAVELGIPLYSFQELSLIHI